MKEDGKTAPGDFGKEKFGADLCFRNRHLTFRKVREEDLEKMFSWRTAPEICRYLYSEPPRNMQEQFEWYNRMRQDDKDIYLIAFKNSSLEAAGYCQLVKIDWKKRTAETGVVVGLRGSGGAGIGFHMAVSLLKIGFTFLEMRSLYSSIDPENLVSLRFFTEYVGASLVDGPHSHRKGDEELYHTSKAVFEEFEKRLLKRSKRWSNVLNIERISTNP